MLPKSLSELPIFEGYNPEALLKTMQGILDKSQKIMTHLMAQQAEKVEQGTIPNIDHDPLNIGRASQELVTHFMMNPVSLMEANLSFWQEQIKVADNVFKRTLGLETEPYIDAAKGDRRFKHEAWNTVPAFDLIKQSYLLSATWLHNTIKEIGIKEAEHANAKKIDFYTRQLIDALAPTNFVATNPEVLFLTLQTGGQNLLNGLNNFLEDLERGKGNLSIKMTDLEAFEPGKNIAVTPGKVVFQNDLMQLIQYTPSTEKVYKRPLLIVPPWINKFYILDLRENNSFVKWAVDQGHSVFVISWVNPDARLADKNFEDYMLEGPLAALGAIEQATGEKEVNAVGYCLGGTLLTSTLAYMASKNDTRIVSATLFTTLLDFKDPGELSIFIDEEQIEALEEKMDEKGYLEGSHMATTFTMLRANDLIWSFHINNYLLGKEASAFDLLYWNSDSTRMPAKMHSFYLRRMYLNNALKTPNNVVLAGQPIDLGNVKIPVCFVSAQEDHIAPWESTYAGTQLVSGEVKFILGGSGHIAGIINPPYKPKYFYYTNDKTKTIDDPKTWLKGASKHEGSWWPHWELWVDQYGGEKVDARTPGTGQLPVVENAPGSYVKVRALAG
ncbi:PHA/PHB synthase family protein [Beggiatoa leptomitoformis]|uniref:Class I poly(R)-hydroxyalkanoic acid synthase n=1 Tax=Beggiatoa leptomitoformis TaxID=288004 RepID=A0A2N9YIE3_9GAMM|nr:class I poly(R)-hydroxyalkanoic acid synthase [Beggiatoa leptomitoformis]ALG67761.1 class I poly(R)-hydroxyalkanoic acid synthase [Beggiatoa leptomitoformis]AUI69996.1 class I poly(R)-hydroxyalkanoic acid synthase [Beggiatoa leptomitoformis]